MHNTGKRYSETAKKVAAGRARKRRQAYEKDQLEKQQLEAQEAQRWEEGARTPNQKKLIMEQKNTEKLRAKKERDQLLAAEEEALGKGGRGKRY
ncbi:ATV_HP_G0010510.mRNA.1.CDS.1 [Saccharomyces cerevisiae]|nr:ATV_HP_G0092480.mRNA.1.CDS.1 [Saccharomyces cerevisiae]CAI5003959.1 ATV_HP_G0143930.mRNA.1.CDS.1 [Saccharomyces cerevisiae]CAI5026070.1 ATV_HP_G0010510.mRNA.1.CDS.1 [Saccharomyces cerevisiae]CAI6506873.1 ATV_HP_G0092480.mRNA.1.CDS.1 [Saccharomyces cerevisiae]CAI6919844.1 ATV_HP_G0143930.mRNA.1.CDS.1 [Saccharomyces cerevisiae]